jgi:hypothetical protein
VWSGAVWVEWVDTAVTITTLFVSTFATTIAAMQCNARPNSKASSQPAYTARQARPPAMQLCSPEPPGKLCSPEQPGKLCSPEPPDKLARTARQARPNRPTCARPNRPKCARPKSPPQLCSPEPQHRFPVWMPTLEAVMPGVLCCMRVVWCCVVWCGVRCVVEWGLVVWCVVMWCGPVWCGVVCRKVLCGVW